MIRAGSRKIKLDTVHRLKHVRDRQYGTSNFMDRVGSSTRNGDGKRGEQETPESGILCVALTEPRNIK